jgi:predicted nucleic acid-binding protein
MPAYTKLFIDANVLVSVLNQEQPLFLYSSRLLSIPSFNNKYKLYTTPISLAIAFYFAAKKCGEKRAKEKISLLCQHINILNVTKQEVIDCLSNKKIHDVEDGLQYYAALNQKCDYIITENKNDFYYSTIRVASCEEFFKIYW